MIVIAITFLVLLQVQVAAADKVANASFAVDVGGGKQPTAMPHIWETCVGSGHARLALRDDWRAAMKAAVERTGMRSVRFHGLFDDDMGPVVAADGSYNFTLIDNVYDFFVHELHIAPYIELSFMPTALASGDETYMFYRANVTPPKSLAAWGALITAFARHLLERYGEDVVSAWRFEVWNEPNLAAGPLGHFWTGTQAQYFALYNETARSLKAVSPKLLVGGPASAGGGWLEDWLAFVKAGDVPADFCSTHHYPGDPGSGDRWSILRDLTNNRATLDNSGFEHLPLVLSEYNSGLFDPFQGNDNHDLPYAASFVATMAPIIAQRPLTDTLSYWAVSDVFEEVLPGRWLEPYHDGYGLITTQGVPKPAFRAFEILHELGDQALPVTVTGSNDTTVTVTATWNANKTAVLVLVSNYQGHDVYANNETYVTVQLKGFPVQKADKLTSSLRRIDHDHANPEALWASWGKPWRVNATQIAQLQQASQVVPEPVPPSAWGTGPDVTLCNLAVPRNGVLAADVHVLDAAV